MQQYMRVRKNSCHISKGIKEGMHGYGSGSGLHINAEVDSMGGVVDGGVGLDIKTSLHRAEIEKAQTDLRQEYDVREETRRELEFLEKGGNPLDFDGVTASLSVQSTSHTDQQRENFVLSEAKGSFALTASPHGDSVESSGRPGDPTVCEPNSADNLLLFHGENDLLEAGRKPVHPSKRSRIAQSEPSCQRDRTKNAKESEDSTIFRPYARRNRSRINRDTARSSSTDVVQSRGGHGSSLLVSGESKDGKNFVSETTIQNDQNVQSTSKCQSPISNGDINPKNVTSASPRTVELDSLQAVTGTNDSKKVNVVEGDLDVTASRSLINNKNKEPLLGCYRKDSIDVASGKPEPDRGKDQEVSEGFAGMPCGARSSQPKESEDPEGEKKNSPNGDQSSRVAIRTKGLDSDASCTHNSLNVDVNIDYNASTNLKKVGSNLLPLGRISNVEVPPNLTCVEEVSKKNETKTVDGKCGLNAARTSANGSVIKVENEIHGITSGLQNEVNYSLMIELDQQNGPTSPETDGKLSDDLISKKDNICTSKPETTADTVTEVLETTESDRSSDPIANPQIVSDIGLKLAEAHEDSILEEARIIEAKHKRIAELSVGTLPLKNQQKSQWEFVLEEMAWLANDFAQERLWKITAAAQICRRVALTSRVRFEEQYRCRKLKKVAIRIADAVLQFWHSAEMLLTCEGPGVDPKDCRHGFVDRNEASSKDKEKNNNMELQYPRKYTGHAIQGYALRFLKYNSSPVPQLQAEAPKTPERMLDSGIIEMSWADNLTEENLFYAVPSGAMETYRKSIEFHGVQSEKTGSSALEEVETSIYDAAAELGYNDNAYDEDERETSSNYLPGAFEGSKASKNSQKKRQNFTNVYTGRPNALGADMAYVNHSNVPQQSMLVVKRAASSINVGSIPTKRMRTASRQRVISPFGAGNLQSQVKADASSGDTNYFQDDQSTLNGGSFVRRSNEVESVGDFEKQFRYDYAETSMKPKKKKKGSTYEQGWQMDSNIHHEQRDHTKRRLDNHHFDSNGLYGQHNTKKPKVMKQSLDNSYDNMNPIDGCIPSPAASQMSNMPHPNKLLKLIGGRDKSRKTKGLKISASQTGSGSPWSLFEDQALVVLVHDMGPNWELVSDAINSNLQFKCIYRKPKECNERHKVLMDKGGGDGADSAEDSGSSQSYPSTLPGIPKGSARQLFQRLQGPIEEETLMSHFENIIMIGNKQHFQRTQNDEQVSKQIVSVHNSHVMSLSQACPNNLNGGVLTPFDLCDSPASSTDVVPPGYQGSHPGGLLTSNQGPVASVHPSSGGSSGMFRGGNLSSPSPSSPVDASVRDGRYGVPRSSFPVEDQHRVQQYNQVIARRNMQQSNLSASGGDRSVRMAPGGNGMGVISGVSRGMPISRPGFQGVASSAVMNSGSVLSPSVGGMPNPVGMITGSGSSQGSSMLRPREAIHMIRPGNNPDHQRQLMVQELQMQATQGKSQGVPSFNGMSSAFPNQTTTSPAQTYPAHPQKQQQHIPPQHSHTLNNSHHPHLQGPNLATGSQQQPYAVRLAKERQRFIQQQQLAASGALMPLVQPQPQPPISSTLQNSSQSQSQTSSQPVVSAPMTPISLQHQQKHPLPHQGLNQNSHSGTTGLTNQSGKPRQRQPQHQFQHSSRQHPPQRQQTQSPQQAKPIKGMGRGNISADPLHRNGLSVVQGSQDAEKGEQIMHKIQGQSLYTGSGVNPGQQARPVVPPQSSSHYQAHQKVVSGSTPPSSKQLQQKPSHSDNSTQCQVSSVPSGHTLPTTHQSALSNHQNLQPPAQPNQKPVNQTQAAKRMLQQNRQGNSDSLGKSQTDQSQPNTQPMKNASRMGSSVATAVPQTCIDSVNTVAAGYSTVASQQKTSEPVTDLGVPSICSKAGSVGSRPSLTNTVGSDSGSSVSEGLVQRQLSGSLSSHGHNVGEKRKHQSQSQQCPPSSQQPYLAHEQQLHPQDRQQSPQQQLPSPKLPHQQTQHLQAASDSLLIRPSNFKVE